jgi:hypothetical protein
MNAAAMPDEDDRPSIFLPITDATCSLPPRGQKTTRRTARKHRKHRSRKYRR